MAYCGNVLMENRNGLAVESRVVIATGTAERDAAVQMVDTVGLRAGTLGADKGYDAQSFTDALRQRGITPHIAQNNGHRRSSIDGRTTRHPGYDVSQRKRKRVEETFGWAKVTGGVRKVKVRGLARVDAVFRLVMAAFNVVRLTNLRRAEA